MARTDQEIITSMGDAPNGIVVNEMSELGLWRSSFAKAVRAFEIILDLFKSDIDLKISTKQYGTINWYLEKSYEFQYGDNLIVDKFGVITYSVINTSNRIISRCAVFTDNNIVYIKVARSDDNILVPLQIQHKTAFIEYINAIKPLGVKIQIISEQSDLINLSVDVFIHTTFTSNSVIDSIKKSLIDYRNNFEFNGLISISDVYNNFIKLEGVQSCNVNSLSWRPNYLPVFESIVRKQLIAGYFNYNLININLFNSQGVLLDNLTVLE